MEFLRWQIVHCVPVVHARLAFAEEVRRRLLEEDFTAVAVELPPFLRPAMEQALELLPVAHVVLYQEWTRGLGREATDSRAWYVPVHPGDAIVEALRVARSERLPVHYVDAEVQDFRSRPAVVPDPYGLRNLGLEAWYRACAPALARHPRTTQDILREQHMAWRLRRIAARARGRILFVCGLAHWATIRHHLETGTVVPLAGEPPHSSQIRVLRPRPRSLPFLTGDLPWLVQAYEEHRRGIELEPFDPARALPGLLLEAARLHRRRHPGSLERPDPPALRTLLDFARKLTVRKGFLIPDSYTLTVAARGVVGNDYALAVLEVAHRYRWNGSPGALDAPEGRATPDLPPPGAAAGAEELAMTDREVVLQGQRLTLRNRLPGTAFQYGRLRLERRPDPAHSRRWRRLWDPSRQCSWPPEDLVIENFRDYVGRRALSLARVARRRVVPFTTSLLDGVDFRATLRDVVERRIWVRDEPRLPGGIGALVLVFEEDDFGERFPWRATWYAEHAQESTLAFYATDYLQDVIGSGVARAWYGGCLLLFPPLLIPDVWEDLRFERARTPSERLLLAGLYHARDRFVVHVGRRPPSPAVRREAERRRRHILHLPLSTFSPRHLERIRRVHVLNGRDVRSWARWFVR